MKGQWRAELNSVKETHDIALLAAFTSLADDAELIKPMDYKKVLPGCVVLVFLTFVNHKFGPKKCTLVAQIDELFVLAPPMEIRAAPSSPSKRKLLDAVRSPSKKSKKTA